MADLAVTSISIEELLKKLRNREWLIPQFQREFVWVVGDVIELIHSIFCTRPIGMATIWEQADDTTLEIGPISLPDRDKGKQLIRASFCERDENPKKVYAVLDGLQRCTAIALAFGGFRTTHGDYRTSGRYFLNVAASDPLEQIIFLKEADVIKKHFDNDATCISQGHFPLSSNQKGEEFLGQWWRYIQAIRNPDFYPNGQMPSEDELSRRDRVLKQAFEGISKTKLAVYIVPGNYSLADICDIFEKLNTTGTKVSTVDLIHSWLYSDTAKDGEGPVRLREWIDDFGQKDGAIGWSDSSDRPELMVQISTATYIALESKTEPRKVGAAANSPIGSLKAGDLLATPTAHWKQIIHASDHIAGYLRDFQFFTAGGLFPWKWCPYPVTSSIYVALRAHASFDPPETHPWNIDDLTSLFRAFFWRNALTNRYDQGFLTQLVVDLRELKSILNERRKFNTGADWCVEAEAKLSALIGRPLPSKDDLLEYVTDGRPGGAMQKALYLPMLASAERDLLDDNIDLRYPQQGSAVQLHHIYPRDWCRNNIVGNLAELLDPQVAGQDWVDAVCNLMPLSRQSNNTWKAKNPGQVIVERNITYAPVASILSKAYIDVQCFEALRRGADGIKEFWIHRADLIIRDLIQRMEITI